MAESDPVAAQYRDMAYASHEVWIIQMWDALNNQLYRKSQELEHLRAYQQQMNGILIENERLRKRIWAIATLLYPYHIPREAVAGDIGWPTQVPQSGN